MPAMTLKDLVEVDPEKPSGTPVFTGTRVPIHHLFEYLEGEETLDEFLRHSRASREIKL
ncbi:MAG: DUF433 domain-containing protein [Acidobacteriota bacterium]